MVGAGVVGAGVATVGDFRKNCRALSGFHMAGRVASNHRKGKQRRAGPGGKRKKATHFAAWVVEWSPNRERLAIRTIYGTEKINREPKLELQRREIGAYH